LFLPLSRMDLLGGYESSSSSTDDVEVEHAPRSIEGTSDLEKLGRGGVTESSLTTSTSTLRPLGAVAGGDDHALDAATSSARPKHGKDAQTLQKQQRVGKKILSLASVLPPHILEALTRATANSNSGTSSTNPYADDSEDSGDDNEELGSTKRKSGTPTVRATSGPESSSNEFSSFLADLQRAAPLHAGDSRPSSHSQLQLHHHDGESTSAARKPASSLASSSTTMGDAFLATTTFTTTSVRSAAATVRDIHASNDEIDDGGTRHSIREIPVPTRPSLSSRICAAPVVGASTVADQTSNEVNRLPIATHQKMGFEASAEPHPPQAQARSRKEMERALRRGQIDTVINDAALTSSIQGADPNNLSMVDPPTMDPDSTTHGMVRNVPTQLYDPSSGGMAAAASMRRGGKNQINQLLAQAAHLERERAQQPSQVAKIQRANAKRKYGW
jgi:hypothetical protein